MGKIGPPIENSRIQAREMHMIDKGCIIETKVYAPDSEVCDEKLCYVCKDGTWEQENTLDLLGKSGGGG